MEIATKGYQFIVMCGCGERNETHKQKVLWQNQLICPKCKQDAQWVRLKEKK